MPKNVEVCQNAFMFGVSFLFNRLARMTQEPLRDQSRSDHDDQRDRDNNGDVSRQRRTQFVPCIDQANRSRHKQQRHNENKKRWHFIDIIKLQHLPFKQKEQQQDAVNVGRYGKRNQYVQHFADKGQRYDNDKLFKQLQGEQLPGNTTIKNTPDFPVSNIISQKLGSHEILFLGIFHNGPFIQKIREFSRYQSNFMVQ